MFPRLPERATFVADPGHKRCFWFCSETFCVCNKCFPVCAAQETSWATMCLRLPGPLERQRGRVHMIRLGQISIAAKLNLKAVQFFGQGSWSQSENRDLNHSIIPLKRCVLVWYIITMNKVKIPHFQDSTLLKIRNFSSPNPSLKHSLTQGDLCCAKKTNRYRVTQQKERL